MPTLQKAIETFFEDLGDNHETKGSFAAWARQVDTWAGCVTCPGCYRQLAYETLKSWLYSLPIDRSVRDEAHQWLIRKLRM